MYTKKELKQSIFNGLSLMKHGDDHKWATFDEIGQLRDSTTGQYFLVNDQKRMFYRDWLKGELQRQAKRGKKQHAKNHT